MLYIEQEDGMLPSCVQLVILESSRIQLNLSVPVLRLTCKDVHIFAEEFVVSNSTCFIISEPWVIL